MSQNGVIRFNELQRKVNGISSLMLSKNLKELEEDSLVIRHQYNEIPPRVEYELSDLSQKLIVALRVLLTGERKFININIHLSNRNFL